MKKKYLFWVTSILLLFGSTQLQAQFTDDFEDWPDSGCPEWWVGWDGTPCAGISVGDGTGPSGGEHVGYIDDSGVSDAVLDLGGKIFDEWYLDFYVYVPAGKEAYMNIQGEVPIGAGQWVVGNIHFNQDLASPGVGVIDNSALGVVTFDFPHDEWFLIQMSWDINAGISLATWSMAVDGQEVIPVGTAFTDSAGTTATSLGGINFFSISTDNQLFLDDIIYSNGFIIGFSDFQSIPFAMAPNPVINELRIDSPETVENLSVYSISGQLLSETKNTNIMDVSQLATGIYFIEVTFLNGKGVQRFVKQ